MWGDDGIVLRLPEAADDLPVDAIGIDPDDIEDLVVSALPQTALFSSRFRECAGRSLLLPRRRPDQRTPLWQQRQRAADLLAVAAKYPTFPVLLEASRECLQDVFDVPALREVLGQLRSRAVRVVTVETSKPSPMAQSLLFNWIAAYMYEGDAPLAERRAAALALDRDLLADLLGVEELRELLDPGVLADVELDVQHLSDGRRARSVDELHDVLRRVGDLTVDRGRAALRGECRLLGGGRSGGAGRRAPGDGDLARRRDALRRRRGRRPLSRRPRLRPAARPAPGVHRPRAASPRGARRPLRPDPRTVRRARCRRPLRRCRSRGSPGRWPPSSSTERIVRGEFRPDGVRREWCDVDILRQLRRRSLAALRREVEPVETATLAEFLPAWQGVSTTRRGIEALVETVGVLAGAPIVASTLEADVLAARIARYQPSMLDELCTAGDVVWLGAGGHRVPTTAASDCASPIRSPCWPRLGTPRGADRRAARHGARRAGRRGASFWSQLRGGGHRPHRRRVADGAVGPRVGRRGHQRLVGGAAGDDGRVGVAGAAPRAPQQPGRAAGGGRRASVASAPPPAPGGGASSPRCSSRAPPTRRRPTPRRCSSSNATASSPVRRCSPRASSADSLPCTGCSRCSRTAARSGAATSSADSAPRSSPCPAPSTACARCAVPTTRLPGVPAFPGRPCRAPATVVLSATDPAQPYGATLPWPESPGRPARIGAALVVLRDGVPLVWHDRRSHHLVTFPAAGNDDSWATALCALVEDGRMRAVEIRKINGDTVSESPDGAWVTAAARAAGSATATAGSSCAAPEPATVPSGRPSPAGGCHADRPRRRR